jgi:hypothetical protein
LYYYSGKWSLNYANTACGYFNNGTKKALFIKSGGLGEEGLGMSVDISGKAVTQREIQFEILFN